jgi:hypothetical protein
LRCSRAAARRIRLRADPRRLYGPWHPYTAIPGLHEPPRAFTVDPARNRDCARRLSELKPELVLFGHGKPLRDAAKLAAFAQSLARD